MDQLQPYTIQFIYEIAEDAIGFLLQASVTVISDSTYFIDDIRLAGKANGSLIPPIKLRKHGGNWIYTDSKKETTLSLAVGHAIETYEQALSSL